MPLACYAVVRSDLGAPAASGVGDAPVRVLAVGTLGLVVSDLLPAVATDADALLAHASVVDAAFAVGPVLPLRFPSLADDERAATSALRGEAGRTLEALLDRVDGRVEVRIRAVHDEERAIAGVLADRPALAAMRNRPERAAALGEALVHGLRARAARHADDLLAHLSPVVDDVRIDRSGGERDVLAASVLCRAEAVDEVARRCGHWEADHPVVVATSAPLPPYSFSDVVRR